MFANCEPIVNQTMYGPAVFCKSGSQRIHTTVDSVSADLLTGAFLGGGGDVGRTATGAPHPRHV